MTSWNLNPPPQSFRPETATVIGAGLAGAWVAWSLCKRGCKVTIVERESQIATKASGNSLGILGPYVADRSSALSNVYSLGFKTALRDLYELDCNGYPTSFESTGILQLPSTKRLDRIISERGKLVGDFDYRYLDGSEVKHISNGFHDSPSLLISSGGIAYPKQVVTSLLADCRDNIDIKLNVKGIDLRSVDSKWILTTGTPENNLISDVVVLCNAYEASHLDAISLFPLEPVRGEVITIPQSIESSALSIPICFDGYITPARNGSHLVGASYKHDDMRVGEDPELQQGIRTTLQETLPDLAKHLTAKHDGRVCFRTSTHDRLPYAGAVPDFRKMLQEAASFRSGTDLSSKVAMRYYSGLWISAGHGSRGLTSAGICAEIIARSVFGEDLAELRECALLLSPGRLCSRILSRRN